MASSTERDLKSFMLVTSWKDIDTQRRSRQESWLGLVSKLTESSCQIPELDITVSSVKQASSYKRKRRKRVWRFSFWQ